MILVTGATGHFGKAAINFLLSKGVPSSGISALVRDASKAEDLSGKGVTLITGDYNDYQSLVKAFSGVDKLLLVSSSDLEARSSQHVNAVKAAKEAGVKHIIYTSFQRKNETNSPIQFISESHLVAESEIKASGLTYTILQNGLYADIIPWFVGEKVFETGIFLPAGQGAAAFTSRLDMAEAAANIVIGSGHENKTYQVATNETNSFAEIANILSEISGKSVGYTAATVPVYTDVLTKAGVPAGYIYMFAGFSEAISQGEFDFTNNDLETLLNRRPTTLKDFLKAVYSAS
ncbi:MAG: SDR family oxidoreductase [Bacteroidales bacterium]|nr:SDR family oxidoreductase [Bacteroidales bacterium]